MSGFSREQEHELLQGFRRSHCGNSGAEHECAGTVSITPKGIELDCPLCGPGEEHLGQLRQEGMERIRRLLDAAGLEWDALSAERQLRVVREAARDACPGCRLELPYDVNPSYYECPCGKYQRWSSGWRETSE